MHPPDPNGRHLLTFAAWVINELENFTSTTARLTSHTKLLRV